MHWEKLMKVHNPSLRFRLILVLSITAVLIWLISTAVAWIQVRKEVNQVFDAQQILFAQRLASSDLRLLLSERAYNPRRSLKKIHFDDDALAFAIFNRKGEMVLSDGRNGENFIYYPHIGFAKNKIHNDDDEWRIFWLPIGDGNLAIAVGQEIDYREDLINKMVFGQMWIWFASLPIFLILIILLINRELQQLKLVSEQVHHRAPDDNTAISTHHLPKEILPLVNGLNQFFEKTSSMLLRERRFTSDAAHELRSPLAALKIQTELAQIAGDDTALRNKALNNLTQGIDRATQLIEQLLTLSRLDNLTELEGIENIYWEKLLPSIISELYFTAQQKQIELIFEWIETPNQYYGQPLLLSLLVRNLISNAIKYCPSGSIVSISLMEKGFSIKDNGGGVEDAHLSKLGQRFYRPAGQNEKGSGLGLSIVYRIAELHQSQIQIKNAIDKNGQKGLMVTMSWT